MVDARRWIGGRIFTGSGYAEALLIEDGHVVVAGTEEEVRRASPTGVETNQLAGRLVIPGLVDSHLHLSELVRQREGVALEGARSIAEAGERIADWSVRNPHGPIFGRGWNQDELIDGRWPDRRDLDRSAPDRPIVLYRICGHVAWANSSALALMGIGRETPDPPGGAIGRDSRGEPNGLLYESALSLAEPIVQSALVVDASRLEPTVRSAVQMGLTSVASMRADLPEIEGLRTLARAGRLPLQVRLYVGIRCLDAVERAGAIDVSRPSGPVRVIGVKAFADGSFGGRTALLDSPYLDAPETSGIAVASPAQLAEVVTRARSRGLAPGIHAIGNRAIDRALDALETDRSPSPPARIEHASLTPPATMDRIDRIRPALIVQPGFLASDYWLEDRLGPERVRWAYAFRTLLEKGHLLAGSSDAPFDSFDPWVGIRCAVRRTDDAGRSANPIRFEGLDPEMAVALYTVNGGRALGDESIGSLRAGARADLVVLNGGRLEQILDRSVTPVAETWSGGARVA